MKRIASFSLAFLIIFVNVTGMERNDDKAMDFEDYSLFNKIWNTTNKKFDKIKTLSENDLFLKRYLRMLQNDSLNFIFNNSSKEFEKKFEAFYNSFNNERLDMPWHNDFSVDEKLKEIYKDHEFYKNSRDYSSKIKLNINLNNYTPHSPIYINGNDDFTPENGVVAGNGTKENPYIIEGWEISASTADGIRIENTTAYFVIKNCYIHDNNGSAIYLFSVLNGCMLNNICSANANYGIFVHFSHYNVINKCSISNNGIGGVCLYFSLSNSIHNCNFLNNGVFIWGSRLSHYIHNIRDNKINDKELFYIINGSNIELRNLSAGQLFLVGCNNVIIKNMVINNVEIGIEIIFCKNILLEGNSFLKIGIGILISRSKIISIINSSFSENNLFGIYVGDSSKVEINGCKIYRSYYSVTLGSVNISIIKNCSLFNNYYGILLYNTHDSIITYCKMDSNNLFGLMLWYSRRSRISYNLCLNNRIDGLSVYSSSNNTLENNFCMNNFKGIAIRDAYYNVLLLNNCSENRQGILLTNTYLNIIVSNRCYRNDIGIYLYNSSNNSIENNSISRNSYNGIALQKSHNNFIYKNNISDYNCIGIVIEESYGNKIIGNDIINNEWIGIGLIKTRRNKIHYNNIYENQIYGIGGFLCFDNARYNYWGSWKGPGLFLNYKFWKKYGFGNSIACYFGWVKYIPYIPWKIKLADINNDTLPYEDFMESVSNSINDFEMGISPGIYIFNRKIISLPKTFIFIDREGIYCSKFNREVYEMLMKMKEKVRKIKNGI